MTTTQTATAAVSTESDRLKAMRAALEVVTEIAENPVSERIAQLFAAAEIKETDEADNSASSSDDPQSATRSLEANDGYSTTQSLAMGDKEAA